MQPRFRYSSPLPLLTLVLFLLSSMVSVRAQEKEYMYEVGASAGLSWGYGDVNTNKAVYSPSFSYGVLGRYNVNLRWALAAELTSSGISGNTADFDYAFPGGDYKFDRRFWQASILPEFHFWNYGLGVDYREKKRYTPFLTAGLTAGVVTGDGNSDFTWGIPLGAGFKVKIKPRLNAHITALFTKTFGDKLDGCADPEGIKTSALMGNDWLASIRIGFTFEFKERCVECKNQNSW